MQGVNLSVEAMVVRASARVSSWRRAAVMSAFCGVLAACGSGDDLLGAPGGAGEAEEETTQSALADDNGLDSNGLDSNGLDSNGLDSNGLATTNGIATPTFQKWLNNYPGASAVMFYLVKCAAPSGVTVQGSVNGVTKKWTGALGVAPSWVNGAPLTLAQQEWMSACLLAHVNRAGKKVDVSFRTADGTTIKSTEAERSQFSCREAAFMGNLFGGRITNQVLPLVQCHEESVKRGTGRNCDPDQDNFDCWADCYAACDKPAGNSSDPFSSCSVSVNGTLRTYSRVITTYLPIDPAQGCLGWGRDFTSREASYTSNTSGASWSNSLEWNARDSSCSQHCGGYAVSGCSCTPDCTANNTCCSDFKALCGTPPSYVSPTVGQSTCPAGYTKVPGTLGAVGASSFWPSASGYQVTLDGAQHATLLGPTASNFDLYVEYLEGTTWRKVAKSERSSANESIHHFYDGKGYTRRWEVKSVTGTGAFTLCVNDLRNAVTLKNLNSSLCVSAAGGGVNNGTKIVQKACVSGTYQAWRMNSVGTKQNQYQLANVNSGKCLDVPNASTATGAVMQEYTCGTMNGQKWNTTNNADGSQTFTSVVSGLCLGVSGTSSSEGAQIVQQTCNGSKAQRFSVQ